MSNSMRVLAWLVLAVGVAVGQWGPIVRLSASDSASQINWRAPLVASGQYVHAIWNDFYSGANCLAYSRSTDGGGSWVAPVPLTGCHSTDFVFASGSASNIHLAYDSSGCVCYRRSTNNGSSWASSDTVVGTGNEDGFRVMASQTGYVFLLWYDWWVDTLYFRRSTNDGASWSAPCQLRGLGEWNTSGTLMMDSLHSLYIAYASNDTIILRRSTDYGATWGVPVPAVVTSGLVNFTCVSDNQSRLHLSWSDSHTGQNEVYYARSTDHGATWSGTTRFTISNGTNLYWLDAMDNAVYVSYYNSTTYGTRRRSLDGGATWAPEDTWPLGPYAIYPPGSAYSPVVLGPGGRVHFIAPMYIYPQGYGIVYYRSRDWGSSWDDTCVSYCDGLSRYAAAIALAGGNVHVLWQDYEYGNYDMFYRRGTGLGGVDEGGDTRAAARRAITASAWPNPVATRTTLRYYLASDADVTLSVRSVDGRDVWSQHIGHQGAGYHRQDWDGCDRTARRVPSGCYFFDVRAGCCSAGSNLLVIGSPGVNGRRPR